MTRMTTRWIVLLGSVGLLAVLNACGAQECVCTSDLQSVLMRVDNPDGTPAENVEVTVTRADDGRTIPRSDLPHGAGLYVVIDDGARALVSPEGTSLIVEGVRGDLGFETEILVGKDSCGCHVEKRAGPDEVVLSRRDEE